MNTTLALAETNLASRTPAAPPALSPSLAPAPLASDLGPLSSARNEAYCRRHCHQGRKHVDRFITATELMKQLTPIGVVLPQHESQGCARVGLTPEQAATAWQKAAKPQAKPHLDLSRMLAPLDKANELLNRAIYNTHPIKPTSQRS